MALHWKILIGLVLGLVWAFLSSTLGFWQFTIDYISPFGDIFVRLLKLLAVPLVFFSIIKGVASLSDISRLGRLGMKTLSFYLMTTVLAIGLGLLLVNTLQPGNRLSEEQKTAIQSNIKNFSTEDGIDKSASKVESKKSDAVKMKDGSPLQFIVDMVPDNIIVALGNNKLMLQVIFFALFFGMAMVTLPNEKTGSVYKVIDGINEIIIKMIELVMRAAPFFVFALMAGLLAKMAKDKPDLLFTIIKGLGYFFVTVVIGLGIMMFAVYPLIIAFISKGKVSYREFFNRIGAAQLFAFSTSSSAATLPVTMEVVRDNMGVSEEVSSFVLPIGATVNMDGTSFYQAVCAVFLAQFFNYDLTFMQQLSIVFTATVASIGTPAVPSAGLVMLIIVLESVGMPAAWIALLLPVDRPLDMLRTSVNVTGDATAATVVAISEGEDLD